MALTGEKSLWNPAVRPIAEAHRLGLFAGAPGDGFLFRDFRLQRAEAGAFMRAVAKRLAFGTPASAPPITPRLDQLHDGRFLKNNWVGHGMVAAKFRVCRNSKQRRAAEGPATDSSMKRAGKILLLAQS